MASLEGLWFPLKDSTPKSKPGAQQVYRKKDALEKSRFEKIHQHLKGSQREVYKRVWKQILLRWI